MKRDERRRRFRPPINVQASAFTFPAWPSSTRTGRHMTRPSAAHLRGRRIDPVAITGLESVADLIDNAFLAYNAGRLREACVLFTERMLAAEVTVGMSLTGAMTPAGSFLLPRHFSMRCDVRVSTDWTRKTTL